jgi:peptide/nickel transport system permease protein
VIGPSLAPAPVAASRERRISWGLALGIALLAILAIVAVGAPLVTSADPTFESIEGLSATGEPLDAGAPGHPLGTDPKGRDLLARILYGGRATLVTALAAVAIATLAGLVVGLAAASSGRFVGSVLMRFTDLGLAIPGLLLAASVATVLGRGVLSLVLGLAAVFWAPIARVTYGQAVVLREREYVEAARVQGASSTAILVRHVFPHLLPVVGAYAALSVGWAVLFESALGFLGAGIVEPDASIGNLLGCCLVYYRSHPGLILFPAIFLFILVASANLVGESLRVQGEADR